MKYIKRDNSRNDNNIKFLLKTIILNNRLDVYKFYIEFAIKNGYKIVSFNEFYNERFNDKKHFILRHDVDHNTPATKLMYELEKKMGIKSSYYFRFSTIDLPLINDMIKNGFEVGLHYETIADYVKKKGCKDISEVNILEVRNQLKNDIERFNKLIGQKCSSCASHGDLINAKLNYPNNMLFEDTSADYYGVLFECYNKELYEKFISCHIMDNTLSLNYGFSYNSNPIDAILKNEKNIVFLSHPNHWYLSFKSRIKLIILLIFGKFQFYTERQFKRI